MPDSTEQTADDARLMRSRFDSCVTASNTWRQQALEDLKFFAGDEKNQYQWDEAARTERATYSQPIFTVNRMQAFVKQVTNQYRLSGPSINVAPAGEDGDEDTAEVLQGIIRHILNVSDGEIAIDTAFECATTHGKGFVYVTVDYIDEDSGQQEILIKRVRNPFTHYPDPNAKEPDLSDARFWFVTDLISRDEYDALYGDSDAGAISATDMAAIGDSQRMTWFPGGNVRLVEYFELVFAKSKKGRRKVKHVRWRKMNGLGTLAETKFPITRIPIVPFFGDETDIDGEVDYRGMVRNGRGPQRILNWTFTYLVEQLSVAPRSPFLVSATQLENFEEIWKLANRRNFPYLPYNDKDAEGRPTGQPPIRNSVEPPIQSTVAALLMAENQFKAVMQLYDPSLGQRKTDQSGKAVLALQQQGEIGNSNYSDNAKRGLRSLGRLLLMMIPKYYDAPRVLRILGRDEQPMRVMVHANKDDQLPDVIPDGVKKIYNLGVGRYDAIVTTGPNFVNKQQEQLATLLDLAKADPQILPLMADLIAKKMGADDVVERLRMVEPLKSILAQGDEQANVAKLKQTLQQFMQQHQVMAAELDAKNRILETDQLKLDNAYKIAELKARTDAVTNRESNEVKLAVAEITSQAKHELESLRLFYEERARLGLQDHEAAMAHADAEHEKDMAHIQAALTPEPEPAAEGASA